VRELRGKVAVVTRRDYKLAVQDPLPTQDLYYRLGGWLDEEH
jgi:hypothetical protein